ncbi:hypothetical protein Gogos_002040, partial [Gossypium gossypioides]|nr:hypothetical protein [Gossypium gossypioides]
MIEWHCFFGPSWGIPQNKHARIYLTDQNHAGDAHKCTYQ